MKTKLVKKVLVVYYSQSGQLLEIAKNVTLSLEEDKNIDLSYYNISLKEDFPFPWNKEKFYDTFPESFLQIPTDLIDLDNPVLQEKYDLIIYAFQVWYLTPSIPANSFLKSEIAEQLFNNTPVVTLIGCRNLWYYAQEKMKRMLLDVNAKLVGNIVLSDKHLNHISVITIVHWMMSGKKEKYLGFFPMPGIAKQYIDESTKFGAVLLPAIITNEYETLQGNLLKIKAVEVKHFLTTVDKKANIIFSKWAQIITKGGRLNNPKRKRLVKLFSFYLLFAIWVVSPIVFIVYLLVLPFTFKRREREINYYEENKLK